MRYSVLSVVAGFIPAWGLENGVTRRLGGDKPRHYITNRPFDQ